MITDRLDRWEQYFSGETLACAFKFLQSLNADSEDKITELKGKDLFARVMSYETKTNQEAKLEAHNKYIDIQMSLIGAERIDWFPRESLKLKTAYNETKDAEYYHRPGDAPMHIDNHPGYFTLLYPDDAHMPQLIVGDAPTLIKKVVIKVNVDLVRNP